MSKVIFTVRIWKAHRTAVDLAECSVQALLCDRWIVKPQVKVGVRTRHQREVVRELVFLVKSVKQDFKG